MTALMSNENEIGNNDVDELWVENDGADDLGIANSTARLGWGRDLAHSLSLSLSLCACEPGNDLKVKQNLHSFSGSKALILWSK